MNMIRINIRLIVDIQMIISIIITISKILTNTMTRGIINTTTDMTNTKITVVNKIMVITTKDMIKGTLRGIKEEDNKTIINKEIINIMTIMTTGMAEEPLKIMIMGTRMLHNNKYNSINRLITLRWPKTL